MATVNQVGVGLSGASGTGSFAGTTSPTFVTPVLGASSATSLAFSSTSGIIGTTTNDSAAAGSVGEFVISTVASGAAVSLVSATAKTITSVSLSAGDWNVWGNIGFLPGAGTTMSALAVGVNNVDNTFPDQTTGSASATIFNLTFNAASSQNFSCNPVRVSLAAPATYYLIGFGTFAVNTLTAYGSIMARRVR